MAPNEASTSALRERVGEWTGCAADAPVTEVVQRVHELLGESPSMLLTATLDDAVGVEERPNYPGTTDERNWSVALPVSIDELEDDPRAKRIAEALSGR
jgi:4-alpha-glucanotransferase